MHEEELIILIAACAVLTSACTLMSTSLADGEKMKKNGMLRPKTRSPEYVN